MRILQKQAFFGVFERIWAKYGIEYKRVRVRAHAYLYIRSARKRAHVRIREQKKIISGEMTFF